MTEYEGSFEEGKPHGEGVWRGKDGATLNIAFNRGQPVGRGVLTTSSGDSIHGAFIRGRGN